MENESRQEPGGASDRELVKRFQDGIDPENAFRKLFARYAPLTYAFFRRRIGNPDHAAEQNQELFLAVLEHLHGFRGDSSFRTWLFRIARNRLLQLRRRWRVHLDELPERVPEGLREDLSDALVPSPDRAAARAEQVRLLLRCMASLPETERAVVLGRYYHEVTLDELTRRLGLDNPSGARASLLAAQRRLRRCLEAGGVDSLDAGAAPGAP